MLSETNGLVHFSTAALDPNQAALQQQLVAEWTHFARTGRPTAAHTPAWTRYVQSSRHSVMLLRPADTSGLSPENSVAAQHNCSFWDGATHY